MLAALVTDPVDRHPAHLPRLRRGAGAGRGRRARLALPAVPAALAGVIAIPVGTVKAAGEDGDRVIYEEETAVQYVRVVEEADGDRRLELNEGIAEHSLIRPGSYLTDNYWDGLLVLPFTSLRAGAGADRDPRQRGRDRRPWLRPLLPAAQIDGVEIDPELAEVGRRYFDMQAPICRSTTRTRGPGSSPPTATTT